MTRASAPVDFGPRHREREKHRVARRNVCGGNAALIERTILGNRAVADQRRSANLRERHVQLEMTPDAERPGDLPRRLDLTGVHLPVANGQRIQLVALLPDDCPRGI